MSKNSSVVRGHNTDFSQLPCGRRFEGKWEQCQALKKAHLKVCVFCKTTIAAGIVKHVVLEPDIHVRNRSDVGQAARAAYAEAQKEQGY